MKPLRIKTIVITLAVIAAMIGAVAIVIPRMLDLNRYHELIVSEVKKSLGGEVRLGHIRWKIIEDIRVEIHGFSIEGASAFPMDFEIPHLSAQISIIPLFSKNVWIGSNWSSVS